MSSTLSAFVLRYVCTHFLLLNKSLWKVIMLTDSKFTRMLCKKCIHVKLSSMLVLYLHHLWVQQKEAVWIHMSLWWLKIGGKLFEVNWRQNRETNIVEKIREMWFEACKVFSSSNGGKKITIVYLREYLRNIRKGGWDAWGPKRKEWQPGIPELVMS